MLGVGLGLGLHLVVELPDVFDVLGAQRLLDRRDCIQTLVAMMRPERALGRIAGSHSVWTQALVSYALVIAFPQLLRWRPIETWTGGVQGLYLDPLPPPGGWLSEDRWLFLMALGLLGSERCVPLARETMAWTRTVLDERARGRPPGARMARVRLRTD